jgi:hypothetical protein
VIALKYQPFNTNSQTHVTILGQHFQGGSHGVYKDGKIGDYCNQNGENFQLCSIIHV